MFSQFFSVCAEKYSFERHIFMPERLNLFIWYKKSLLDSWKLLRGVFLPCARPRSRAA